MFDSFAAIVAIWIAGEAGYDPVRMQSFREGETITNVLILTDRPVPLNLCLAGAEDPQVLANVAKMEDALPDHATVVSVTLQCGPTVATLRQLTEIAEGLGQ